MSTWLLSPWILLFLETVACRWEQMLGAFLAASRELSGSWEFVCQIREPLVKLSLTLREAEWKGSARTGKKTMTQFYSNTADRVFNPVYLLRPLWQPEEAGRGDNTLIKLGLCKATVRPCTYKMLKLVHKLRASKTWCVCFSAELPCISRETMNIDSCASQECRNYPDLGSFPTQIQLRMAIYF